MNTWSERISDLRKIGLTLGEIGQLVGLAPSSVSDIEQERTRVPNGDAAVKLLELHMSRCDPSIKRRAG